MRISKDYIKTVEISFVRFQGWRVVTSHLGLQINITLVPLKAMLYSQYKIRLKYKSQYNFYNIHVFQILFLLIVHALNLRYQQTNIIIWIKNILSSLMGAYFILELVVTYKMHHHSPVLGYLNYVFW